MSQLPRTKTIRLSTPKTITGDNLILGFTSPLIDARHYALCAYWACFLNPSCTTHLMYVRGDHSQRSNHGMKSRQLLYKQVVFS